MTDSYDGPPLTRRERKERERAAAAATTESAPTTPPADQADAEAGAAAQPEAADAAQPETPAQSAPAQPDPAAAERFAPPQPAQQQAPVAPVLPPERREPEFEVPETALQRPTPAPQPAALHDATPATEAIDMSTVLGGRGQASPAATPSTAQEPAHDDVEDVFAAALQEEPHEEVDEAPAARGLGRFFGRRKEQEFDEAEPGVDEPSLDGGDPLASLAKAAGQDDEPVAPDAGSAPVSVPRPSLASPTAMPKIDVQRLDTVDDDEVDRLEIDEVMVDDRRPVSSRWIAEATPAELEDRRAAEAAVEAEVEPTDEQAGPRRVGRAPVVVNVVEDTSEHHIADLRAAETASIASASSVGTGTSTITANALVLPASGAHEPIEIAGDDGVIVTGSIDLPDGFASSGRTRGTIDMADVDATVDDPGELRSPETQPVRASKAVSSYANARVQIAPQRRSNNTLPIAIGVGGGVVVLGIGAVTIMAVVFGWF